MKSYAQDCAVAQSLDLVGDRWTLLIVRELMVAEASRYTDLQKGLPGIATNLLAKRLKEMEESELLAREEAPPPIATTVFRLTERGRGLEPVLAALGVWGMSLPQTKQAKSHFPVRNLRLPLHLYLTTSSVKPILIRIQTENETVTVRVARERTTTTFAESGQADLSLSGNPYTILGLLLKRKSVSEAQSSGVRIEGDVSALKRVVTRWSSPA